MIGTTINDRIQEAIEIVNKIRWTSYSYYQKARMIITASLPKGLYGTESAPYAESLMQRFRSAIANTIAPMAMVELVVPVAMVVLTAIVCCGGLSETLRPQRTHARGW